MRRSKFVCPRGTIENMRVLGLAVALVSTLAAQPTTADQQVSLGVEAYRSARYAAAAEHFAAALKLDPGYVDARLYLATAYMSQYIPGSKDPANLRLAEQALDEFQQVLVLDPEQEMALASIALLYFNERKFEDAREWYEKLISLDPDNKEGWYTLGVIAWSQWRPAYDEARAKLNMKTDDAGALPDKSVREDLKRRYGATVDEGIRDLEKALSIAPNYADAMVYLNLLLRGRAGWAESQAECDKDIAAADGWLRKADETRKRKTEHVPARP
jgi:tetratricopeptide (TPR) repeat protein